MTTLLSPTPGPWRLHIDGLAVFGVGPHAQQVADLEVCSPNLPQSERSANARLIAAAPTMFETLQAVWRLVETLDIGIAEKSQIRDLVYPAIDEARGPYPRVGTL